MLKIRSVLLNSKAAIDLASIMVGIIVIGLIGGVIAATVFAVIPWAQDSAAKQQLESIHTAQNAAFGLSADPSRELPVGQERNSFTNSQGLEDQSLLIQGETYCTVNQGKDDYLAYSKSGSGQVFIASNKNRQAVPLIGAVADGCKAVIANPSAPGTDVPSEPETPGNPGTGTDPGVGTPTPPITAPPVYGTRTSFTYRCDSTTNGVRPPVYGAQGTLTWVNKTTQEVVGTPQQLNNTTPTGVSLQAGVEYQVTLDGTFSRLSSTINTGSGSVVAHASCLRSMDEWNENSGTLDATYGFRLSPNLVSVPSQIPSTVENISFMFEGATKFNANINSWDVSNVEHAGNLFSRTDAFNQPLNNWDVSGIKSFGNMFSQATAFNQPLDNWVTDQVTSFQFTFYKATAFNQNIGGWKTGNATNMRGMFQDATNFNQNIANWDVSKVTNMEQTFMNATNFNQNISGWDVTRVTSYNAFKVGSGLSAENTPVKFNR